jgi:RsiW-degrading membrane proteinase PrsW (M82 family)
MGAALIESFYYVRLTDNVLQSISTEFARLVLHMLLGGLAGFGVGLAACRVSGWKWKLPTAFATAATLHFLWDWQCGIPAMMGPASLTSRLIAVGLMITAMALFGVITLAGAGQSANKFKATKLRQLWGWPFNRFLR